jgi:hypothetical protein
MKIHYPVRPSRSLVLAAILGGAISLWANADPAGSFAFSTEVKRPDLSAEAKDTAPKYNPTSHVRTTTKEEAGNFKPRDILGGKYDSAAIRAALVPAGSFRPYPDAGAEAYQALPADERDAIIAAAEGFLGYDWPTLTATLYLDHYETGSLRAFQQAYFKRIKALETLLYAEVLEGDGRFIRDIANGVWAICEQTTWAQPAHLNVEIPGAGLPTRDHPILALLATETAATLAAVHYFVADELNELNPQFGPRMREEVRHHVLTPYLERTDYWWMAYEKPFTNNWNPWITSNYLLCALVFSETDEELAAYVLKAIDVLDHFLNVYPEDGGCEEGPAYWDHASGRMLDCLRLLDQATGGLINIYDEPLVRAMGDFMWKAHIAPPWYVNFADAFARYKPDASTLYRYGKATGSDKLMAFAATKPLKPYFSMARSEYLFLRQLPNMFVREELTSYAAEFIASEFEVLPDLETAYVRQSPEVDEGFYLAAKGGYNAESHNHNDIGTFIVFLDGEPLFIDVGVGTYTSKTFSEQRYEIWSMQSSYHNLPDINGTAQPHMIPWRSDSFAAHDHGTEAIIQIGITPAYSSAANLVDFHRTLRLDRASESIHIMDTMAFADDRAAAGGNQLDFHLMTHHEPSPGSVAGTIELAHPDSGEIRAALTYAPDLDVLVTKIVLEDQRLIASWGDTIYRITLSDTLGKDETERDYPFVIQRAD